MKQNLSAADLADFEKAYAKNPQKAIASRSVIANGLQSSATDSEVVRSIPPVFSLDLDAGTITNQKQSGRCWMFAGLNVLRTILIQKLKVKNFELSQNFLTFYDRLEKANFFLERMIELTAEPYDSPLNVFMLTNGFGDGGHWAMFVNLVKKYGIAPKEAMAETVSSENTAVLNRLLLSRLSEDVAFLRTKADAGEGRDHLRAYKTDMMKEIYDILAIAYGVPPTRFVVEGKDKKDKFFRLPEMTPKAFFDKYIGVDLDSYISLTDAPLPGWKRGEAVTCRYVNNVEGGDPVLFFNQPIEVLKNAVVASLKGKDPVWFAADVLSQSLRKEGILASGILKYGPLCGFEDHSTKASRLAYWASTCDHAMTFTGVNLVNDKPNRFKVENSWGKENGTDGFFVMSDSWFDDYVYQVIVKEKYVDKTIVDAYHAAKPHDVSPFGAMWKED